MLGVVANHGDVRGIALVARARVRKIVDADAHCAPSTTTCELTRLRGSSTDFTATTARTRRQRRPARAYAWREPQSRWHALPCAGACVRQAAAVLRRALALSPPDRGAPACQSG